MELCDVYDANRTPLGITHDRETPLPPGRFIVVVGIWVFNGRREILLTKRHPDKKFAPNLWENTGGHVNAGETSTAAAVRELREETGIRTTEDELIFLGSIQNHRYFGDNYAIRRDVPVEEIRLQEGETCDAQWVTLPRFEEMIVCGELAPSVAAHLKPIRAAFDAALLGA